MNRKKKWATRSTSPLYTWRADRRASRGHIREAIRMARDDLAQSAALLADKAAFDRQCGMMQIHAKQTAGRTLRDVARQALEYWRSRAFMPGAYSGYPGDRPAFEKWQAFDEAPVARAGETS